VLYSFLITLREGLEAALVLGILMAYLAKVGRREGSGPILTGAGLAVLVSVAGGAALRSWSGGLSGAAMEIWEGGMMLIATAILTHMLIWMQQQSRGLKASLQQRMDSALDSGNTWALGALAFTVVVREGLETVLFLSAGAGASGSAALYTAGAAVGGLAAALLGYLLYRGSLRLNLKVFFRVTGLLLVVCAAGMLANGIKELHEAGLIPQVVSQVWDTYDILPDTTAVGRFLSALFGYDATPSLIQVTGYFGYLLLAGFALIRSNTRGGASH
jgi:high-affinity iron transporter